VSDQSVDDLLTAPLRVINVGLEGLAESLEALEIPVVQVDWRPPAGGDPKLADLLSKLGT
jgi:FdrA protein